MIRVLFVCLGNICRSPTAEGVFRALVQEHGLATIIETDSCGTSGWHIGEAPDDRAQAEAKARGIDISDLRGRALQQSDFDTFDYILGMDQKNLGALKAECPAQNLEKCHLLLDFHPDHRGREIPDPYYGTDDGFARVYDLIDGATQGLLLDIQRRYPEAFK